MDHPDLPARDRILHAAHDLFYAEGVRATGVDRVIAASGVAKLTFYRHFPSKNELVLAYLHMRHERWMAWLQDALNRHGAGPSSGLMPVHAAMKEWFTSPGFRGCAFVNAVTEIGPALPEALAIARQHKAEMIDAFIALLPASRTRRAHAEAVAAAVDGAIVRAQMGQPEDVASALRSLQRVIAALQG